MKIFISACIFLLIGTSFQSSLFVNKPYILGEVPDFKVQSSELNSQKGKKYFQGKLFSGFAQEFHPNKMLKSLTGYINGKKEGIEVEWYSTGSLLTQRHFSEGKKVNVHSGWWENGNLKFLYHFEEGLHEGEGKEWFKHGQIYLLTHHQKGQEIGVQKRWSKTGNILSNYVIKNGRRFGLMGTKPCTSIRKKK